MAAELPLNAPRRARRSMAMAAKTPFGPQPSWVARNQPRDLQHPEADHVHPGGVSVSPAPLKAWASTMP